MLNNAKSKVLQSIIDMMDHKMLGGLKKKGEKPAVMAVDIHADKGGESDPLAALKGEQAEDEGGDNEDTLRQLLSMYSKDEDEENGDKSQPC